MSTQRILGDGVLRGGERERRRESVEFKASSFCVRVGDERQKKPPQFGTSALGGGGIYN